VWWGFFLGLTAYYVGRQEAPDDHSVLGLINFLQFSSVEHAGLQETQQFPQGLLGRWVRFPFSRILLERGLRSILVDLHNLL
jgi:hypothetical protein